MTPRTNTNFISRYYTFYLLLLVERSLELTEFKKDSNSKRKTWKKIFILSSFDLSLQPSFHLLLGHGISCTHIFTESKNFVLRFSENTTRIRASRIVLLVGWRRRHDMSRHKHPFYQPPSTEREQNAGYTYKGALVRPAIVMSRELVNSVYVITRGRTSGPEPAGPARAGPRQ